MEEDDREKNSRVLEMRVCGCREEHIVTHILDQIWRKDGSAHLSGF